MVLRMTYELSQVERVLAEAQRLIVEHERMRAEAAARLLRSARRTVVEHVDEYRDAAEQVLYRFEGLPVSTNPLKICGAAEAEVVHTQVLAWLLEPDESHGLGDFLLREFLLATGSGVLRRVAGSGTTIPVEVRAECGFPHGICDLVLVVPGAVVGIECKVWAVEHQIKIFDGKSYPQTGAYRRQLEDDDCRARVLANVGGRATELAGSSPTVAMLFVAPRGAPGCLDAKTKSIDWLRVEAALAVASRRGRGEPDAVSFVNGFRTNLLSHSGSKSPVMPRLAEARRLVDHSGLRDADPLGAYLRLRELVDFLDGDEHG
jgi:hypothetical protein